MRTYLVTEQIFVYGHLVPAHAAQHCGLMPLGGWPDFNRVIGQSVMALFARVVKAATVHLDRNDINWGVVVIASCLRVDIYPKNFRRSEFHVYSDYKWTLWVPNPAAALSSQAQNRLLSTRLHVGKRVSLTLDGVAVMAPNPFPSNCVTGSESQQAAPQVLVP